MEGIRGHLHPLQDPDVLEYVFKNLELADVKKCRLVCKVWCHSSTEAMRSCAQITIDNEAIKVALKIKTTKKRSVRKFRRFVQGPACKFFEAPFADTFQIKTGTMHLPIFWRLCGHTMKSLSLEQVTFKSVDNVRHVLFRSCPNLEKLSLHEVRVEGWENLSRSPDYEREEPEKPNKNLKSFKFISLFAFDLGLSWIEIFSNFPSIQDLNVDHDVRCGLDKIFKSLAFVRKQDADALNLKKLSFKFHLVETPEELGSVFLDGKIALEELEVQWVLWPEDARTLEKILAAQAPSLKKLSIKTGYLYIVDLFPLPGNAALENLEELSLSIGDSLESMIFVGYVPNLKKLRLSIREIPEARSYEQFELTMCTELVLEDMDNPSVEDVRRFGKWLPNLEKLEWQNLDNEIFACVCQCWPNLISLRLSASRVDDCGISGLDVEDVERINREGEEGTWRPITVQRPNIACLKNLDEFTWESADPEIGLGYCSEVYGIQALTKVQGEVWEREKLKVEAES